MKAKINNDGNLEIERKGTWRKQECMNIFKYCGDHCPAFFEIGEEDTPDIVRTCTGAVHEIVEDER